MRFLTLNTHSWCEIHQIAKIRTLAKFIIEQQVDVIALQEVNQLTSTPVVKEPLNYRGGAGVPVHEDNYALLLVQALNEMGATYEWALTEAHIGWDLYDECVAILSRLPIRGVKPIDMSPSTATTRYSAVQHRRRSSKLRQVPSGAQLPTCPGGTSAVSPLRSGIHPPFTGPGRMCPHRTRTARRRL